MPIDLVVDDELTLDPHAADLLFREAGTANSWADEPVTESQARTIYELTKMGPTAFNGQPLRITYVRTSGARQRLARHLSSGNQAKTLAAPLTAILSFDTAWPEQWENFLPGGMGAKARFEGKPELTAAAGRDSAHIQAGYFILAIRAVGLAAGPMSGFDADAVDAEFFPEGGRRSFLVVNIGKPGPNAWGDPKPRLAYEDVVTTV